MCIQRLLLSVTLLMGAAPAATADLVGYALIREDGSLQVENRTVRLFGIYIPPTDRTCLTFISPVQCGPRAVLQLEFKIGSHFVHCDKVGRDDDGATLAYCSLDGDDLGAWMLSQGWALAAPDAPFEYVALERIAQTRQVGVWGFAADNVIRRRRGSRR